MRETKFHCWTLACALWLVACGSTERDPAASGGTNGSGNAGRGGGAGHAGQSQGGGGAASVEGACFDPESARTDCATLTPGARPVRPVELARAEDIALGARFTRLGGLAALAELPEGQPPRVVVANPHEAALEIFDVEVSGESGELSIVDVWANSTQGADEPPRVVALGCNPAGCELLGLQANESGLRTLPEYELPRGVQVRRLVATEGRLCAYGQGLFCLVEGNWRSQLPESVDGEVVAATLGAPPAAITHDGSLFVETDGGWVGWSTSVTEPMAIDAYDGVVSVLGADGQWFVASPDSNAESLCQQTPALKLAVPRAAPLGQPWRVVDGTGAVYEQHFPSYAWCQLASGVELPLLGTSRVDCGAAVNLLAISEQSFLSLLGPLACYLT